MNDKTARARWQRNGPRTMILKCCVKDGSDVLAALERLPDNTWRWEVFDQIGVADDRYTAMRRARKALR